MKYLIVIIVLLSFSVTSNADEITYTIQSGDPQNVTFHSKASIESFQGTTSHISGTIILDPNDVSTATGVFTVDMRTLDTGIGLRNTHMRENNLHTDQYPEATFEITAVNSDDSLTEGITIDFVAVGDFTCHGETKQIEVNISVTPTSTPQLALHITGEFQVSLPDFNIPRPQFLILKLAEVQRVTLDLRATSGK